MLTKLFTGSSLRKTILLSLIMLASQVSATENHDLTLVVTPDQCFVNGYYQCTLCPCSYESYPWMTYMNIVFEILGITLSLIVVVLFFMVKEIRTPPGDIICVISFTDLLWSGNMLSMNIYHWVTGISAPLSYDMCARVSMIYLISIYLQNTYTLSFFLYYLYSLKYALRGSFPHAIYHLIPLIVSSIFFRNAYTKDAFGMSEYGSCNSKTHSEAFWSLGIMVIYIVVPVYTLYYTHKYAPRNEKYSKATKLFLEHYRLYVMFSSFILLVVSGIDVVQSMYAEQYYYDMQENTHSSFLFIVKAVGTFVKPWHPVLLNGIRLTDPLIRKHLHKVICCLKKPKVEEEIECPMRDRVISVDAEFLQKNIDKDTYIKQIQHSLKVQAIYSILSSLHYFWHSYTQNKAEKYIINSEKFYSKEVKVKQRYNINEELLQKEIPEVLEEIKGKKYKTVSGVLTVYAPAIFEEVIELDGMTSEMANSLDLKKNFTRILKAGINTGGKSGEFFFFSSDNKLIIKTITDKEVKALLRILPTYVQHFKNNPFSLLAKIYGVFTFERFDPSEKYNLILMRNINGYPSSCVERKYDLKGSTVGRMTIKPELNLKLSELKYYDTLKDMDFNKYEQKLWISDDIKGHLFETLRKDVQFLSSHGLIDYSLAVYVINKEVVSSLTARESVAYREGSFMNKAFNRMDTSMNEASLRHLIEEQKNVEYITNAGENQSFASIKSISENFYYHIGIIDYLIVYDCKKVLEKYSKKIGAFNPNYDISVQNPTYYSQRFSKYVQTITF